MSPEEEFWAQWDAAAAEAEPGPVPALLETMPLPDGYAFPAEAWLIGQSLPDGWQRGDGR